MDATNGLEPAAESAAKKMLIFSDGAVGTEIVRFALHTFPEQVAGIVVTDLAGEIANLVQSLGQDIPLLKWRFPDAARFRSDLADIGADIYLLAWWPHLLRDELSCGQLLTLNFHPSLLPHNRGKNPNFWALTEQVPFGVSIHHVVQELDAGPIAFQRQIPYGWEDNGGTLYARAQQEIVSLFAENYQRILNLDVPSIPQDPEVGSFHFSRELDPSSAIDLDAPNTARDVFNLVRARTFAPHRGCWFLEGNQLFEVTINVRHVEVTN